MECKESCICCFKLKEAVLLLLAYKSIYVADDEEMDKIEFEIRFYREEFERLRKEILEIKIHDNFKQNLPVVELSLFGLNI